MRNPKAPRRTAKDRREDLRLIDELVDKHISIAFGCCFSMLSKRNPRGSCERSIADFYSALESSAKKRMVGLGLK